MLRDVLARVRAFEREANVVLSFHESSRSRSIELEETYRRLGKLGLAQDELFLEALRCIEERLYRAAHVMAWAGFMDVLSQKLVKQHSGPLRKLRPKWIFADLEDFRESIVEFQILEAARDLRLFTKTETKALQGLLSKRNECAHPSSYFPNLNEAVGYVAELLHRMERIV